MALDTSLAWITKRNAGSSVVHRLAPGPKLVCAGLVALALLLARDWLALALLSGFLAMALYAAGIGPRAIAMPLRATRVFLLLCVVTQALFYAGEAAWQLGPLSVGWDGLLAGTALAARLALLMVVSVLLTQTTSPTRLVETLREVLHPLGRYGRPLEDVLLMLALAGRWVPVLAAEVSAVLHARRSRGLPPVALGRRWALEVVDVAGQVFDRAMRRADAMADAMQCRGYRPGVRRSRRPQGRPGRADALAMLVTAVVVAAVLWL